MIAKNLLKKTGMGLLCLLIIALIVINIFQYRRTKIASQSLSSQPPPAGESKTAITGPSGAAVPLTGTEAVNKKPAGNAMTAAAGKTSSGNEVEDLSYQLGAAEEELDAVNKKLSDEETRKADLKKTQIELQKKYLKDPSFKKSMRNSMDTQYKDLFKELNLSPERLEKFKDLLVDEMTAQQNIYVDMELGNAPPTKEQQAELTRRYTKLGEEYEAKKSDLLGKNDYEKYQTYTEREGERYYANGFIESLSSSEKLNDEQKNNLIEGMFKEVKTVRNAYKSDDASEQSENRYDEKSIARTLDLLDRRNEAYLKAGNGILSASQTEQFKAYLKRQRDMFEASMKMQALRYGTQTTDNSTTKTSN